VAKVSERFQFVPSKNANTGLPAAPFEKYATLPVEATVGAVATVNTPRLTGPENEVCAIMIPCICSTSFYSLCIVRWVGL
jgi:hypothetical protein